MDNKLKIKSFKKSKDYGNKNGQFSKRNNKMQIILKMQLNSYNWMSRVFGQKNMRGYQN